MSLQHTLAQPHPAPRPTPTRRLRAVPAVQARRRPRLAYATLAVGGALAIAAAQMGVSLATTQDAFVLAGLTTQQHDLSLEAQALHENLVGLSSPQSLASKADELGLVVAGPASYLRLSDGRVLGAGEGADGRSNVSPNGSGAVANALLRPPAPPVPAPTASGAASSGAASERPVQDVDAAASAPALPPTLTEGLPSPTTR